MTGLRRALGRDAGQSVAPRGKLRGVMARTVLRAFDEEIGAQCSTGAHLLGGGRATGSAGKAADS